MIRDYTKATKYEEQPAQVKHREERNKARAEETKRLGRKPAGDVAHIVPESKGGHTTAKNVRVESVAKNRGWRAGRRGYDVPVDK
jgi:hypothetical protein